MRSSDARTNTGRVASAWRSIREIEADKEVEGQDRSKPCLIKWQGGSATPSCIRRASVPLSARASKGLSVLNSRYNSLLRRWSGLRPQ